MAFSLLNKLLDEFVLKVPKSSWEARAGTIAMSGAVPAKGDGIVRAADFPQAQEYLARYQDPRQADTILRVQQELDDTKIVLVRGTACTHLTCSTTPLTPFCSAVRTSTSWSRKVARSARRARCSTSLRGRYVGVAWRD